MRLLPLLALGCSGSEDCELAAELGAAGGTTELVRTGLGSHAVSIAGTVSGTEGAVTLTPTVTELPSGRVLTGAIRPVDTTLSGGAFGGLLATLVLSPEEVCALDGAQVEIAVEVEDPAGCTTTASGLSTVTLSALDRAACDSTPIETGETGETGDTGTPPTPCVGELPRLRAIHVAPDLPGQDMLGNGVPGNPELVDLQFGETWPADGGAERPAVAVDFEYFDTGSATPWDTFSHTLQECTMHTFVVAGTRDGVGPAADVWLFDDDVEVSPSRVRVRWTHAAVDFPGPIEVRDAVSGFTYASLTGFGDSVVVEGNPVDIRVLADLGGTETCFAPFQREGGDSFHALFVHDGAGDLILQGQTMDGNNPIQPAVPCP